MDINDLRVLITLLIVIGFCGLCYNLFVRHKAEDFDEAAAQVFDSEPAEAASDPQKLTAAAENAAKENAAKENAAETGTSDSDPVNTSSKV